MAYGFATHLWIHRAPELATLRQWALEAVPDLTEADLEVFRLGERVLLAAINVSDRQARWRSIGCVQSLAAHLPGDLATTFVDFQPDHGSWVVDEAVDPADPAQLAAARARVRQLVPLQLEELAHYVDWANELEDTEDGAPVPELPGTVVQRLSLGLPAGASVPPQPPSRPTGEQVAHPWVWIGLALAAAALFLRIVL